MTKQRKRQSIVYTPYSQPVSVPGHSYLLVPSGRYIALGTSAAYIAPAPKQCHTAAYHAAHTWQEDRRQYQCNGFGTAFLPSGWLSDDE